MSKTAVRQLGLKQKHQQRQNFPLVFGAAAAAHGQLTIPLFSLPALRSSWTWSLIKCILLSIANKGNVEKFQSCVCNHGTTQFWKAQHSKCLYCCYLRSAFLQIAMRLFSPSTLYCSHGVWKGLKNNGMQNEWMNEWTDELQFSPSRNHECSDHFFLVV